MDVQAKAENVAGLIPVDEFRGMLRMLLEDRFQLKAHREASDRPVYELTIDKSGLKLKASVDDGFPGTIQSVRREAFPASLRGCRRSFSSPSSTRLVSQTGMTSL